MTDRTGAADAVRAMRYWELRQQALAHNLANVSTPGFKAERVFAHLLTGTAPEAISATDFRQGGPNPTGRTLDVALSGDGFLVVETPQGERLARGGALTLGPDGTLTTPAGEPVLGDSGPLVLPDGDVSIAADGRISVGGQSIGRLRVERPAAETRLLREGEGLWRAEGATEASPDGAVELLQGHLEESNVDPMTALVEMIEIQKAYGAIQRSVQTNDEVAHTISTEIGRIG